MISVRRIEKQSEADAALLSRIASGELDALGGLFERYQHDVRRALMRLGAGPDLDDLLQLTFLEVTIAAKSFDGRASARPWLLGIAVTMMRRRRNSLAKMAARLGALFASKPSKPREGPDDAFEGRELEERLRRALFELSPKKREVFVLVALEGLSGEEVATTLGIPVNTVWTRLHHARTELRHALEEAAR